MKQTSSDKRKLAETLFQAKAARRRRMAALPIEEKNQNPHKNAEAVQRHQKKNR